MSDSEDIYAYQLVEFVKRGPKKVRQIDCVPSSWVMFDKKLGKCVCKFLQPPYDAEDTKLIDSLVQCQAAAPESWPTYTVELRGQASMEKLKSLEEKLYFFTTESEVGPKQKAALLVKSIRSKKLKKDEEQIAALMTVRPISRSDNESEFLPASPDRDCSDTDNSSVASQKVSRNKKLKKIGKQTAKPQHKIKRSFSSKRDADESRKLRVQAAKKDIDIACHNSVHLQRKKNPDDTINIRQPDFEAPKKKIEINNNRFQLMKPSCSGIGKQGPEIISKVVTDSSETDKTAGSRQKSKGSNKVINKEPSTDNEFDLIMKAIKGISVDVQELSRKMQDFHSFIENSVRLRDGAYQENHLEKYNFKFPITEYDEFVDFDNKIKADKNLRKDLTSSLHFYLDRNNIISRSITNILKRYLAREIVLQFTAV